MIKYLQVFLVAAVVRLFPFVAIGMAAVPGNERWYNFGGGGVGTAVPDYGVDGVVYAVAAYGHQLYVGGTFKKAYQSASDYTGFDVNAIAKWNSSNWVALGRGVYSQRQIDYYTWIENERISAIAASGTNVWVGGICTLAVNSNGSNVAISNIARWDGSRWWDVGGGVTNNGPLKTSVSAIETDGQYVYVGGTFTQVGGILATNIARWDGSNWSPLGSGVSGSVADMIVTNGRVYVVQGGDYNPYHQLSMWDGTQWINLGRAVYYSNGSWVEGSLSTVAICGTNIYVGGNFGGIRGTNGVIVTAQNIAKWDGKNWSGLDGGNLDSWVYALRARDNVLYVGGPFTSAGGLVVNHIVKWNEGTWLAMGSGVDDTVQSLCVSSNSVYAGGWFSQAGGQSAKYIARFDDWISDLSVIQSQSPAAPNVGQTVTCSILLTNRGPDSAANTMLRQGVPSGFTYSSASASQGSWSYSQGVVTFALGTVGNGGTVTATVNFVPQVGGGYCLTSSVASASYEANPSDNQSSLCGFANPGPTVQLTAPAPSTMFFSPTNVTIVATATDSNGVALVEFFANGSKIGQDSTEPYNMVWTPSAGTYSLTAKATDTLGATNVSAGVAVQVITCSYSIFPAGITAAISGGVGSVAVTASNSNCVWTAASNVGWMTITSGSSGTGNGTVTFSVDSNSGNCVSRMGTLTIAGNTFVVTEPAGAGSYAISPTSRAHGYSSETGSVTVTAGAGCTWTASNATSWLTITSGISGTGNGVVYYSVASNAANCISRTGTLSIAGTTFTVTQAAGTGSYSIAPTNRSHGAGAESASVTVIAGNGCSWTATSNDSWISVTGGSTGTGNGSAGYALQVNNTGITRTGTVTIAGQTFTVTQATCAFTILPSARTHGAGTESGTIIVGTTSGCPWSSVSNDSWISITSGSSGTGSGAVGYALQVNNTGSTRTGTMTIAGQTFTVTQTTCSYALSSTFASFSANGGSSNVVVSTTTGCSWTADSSVGWITITSGPSGVGNGSVTYSVASNPNLSGRSGIVTIAGQAVTVTQAGNVPPQVSIQPVAPVTLPVKTVNLSATVTDDGAPSGTLSALWSKTSGAGTVSFGNASAFNTTATFSTNGTYWLQLVASDGALATTGTVAVTVNARPVIVTPPAVSNAVSTVGGVPVLVPGEPFTFTAAATDADGNALACSWNFGDGVTSADCQPSHVFTNCGPHTVTYIVTDGISPITNTLAVAVACPFEESLKLLSLTLKSNFAPGKLDQASLKTAVDLPVGTSANNVTAQLSIGGVTVPFTLDSKGRGLNGYSSLKLQHKGKGSNTLWQVTAKLKGDFDAIWAEDGLTNATTSGPIKVPVLLLLDTDPPESFYIEKALLYKATQGKSGSAK